MNGKQPPRAFFVIAAVAIAWFALRGEWFGLLVIAPVVVIALVLVARRHGQG